MKMRIGVLVGLVVLMGCATTPKNGGMDAAPPIKTGFLKDYESQLGPGPEDGVRQRWLRPGVEWTKYHKVMLDSVVFFFDDASEYKGIDANELKDLADNFNRKLVEAIGAKYPIVAEPGPDVVRLRFAITDLKQSRPVMSGVTSVIPVGLAMSIVKKGATDAWTGSGATSAEMMALDSQSNTVLAVARDERSAGFTERFSKWGSAEEAFQFWGERIVLFMDDVRTSK